jgi:hypothetical protein
MGARYLFALLLTTSAALAQFTPSLIQNDNYWNDGKAEFSIYRAEIVREGAPRPCEVLHILVREPFDPKQLVKAEGAPRPDGIQVVKLNQILNMPTGLTFMTRCTRVFGGLITRNSSSLA